MQLQPKDNFLFVCEVVPKLILPGEYVKLNTKMHITLTNFDWFDTHLQKIS